MDRTLLRHRIRRRPHHHRPAPGRGRGGDHGPLSWRRNGQPRRHRRHRHRRPGHEISGHHRRRHRLDRRQRSLLVRLRLVPADLRHVHGPDDSGIHAKGFGIHPSGGPWLALHRVHELLGQAGAEGRRLHRGHRRRAVLLRGAQRPVQGHQAARFRRTRRHCGGPGRYVPQRRRAARVRTAHRTRSHPTEHRRPHGRVRRGPHRPHALRGHRGRRQRARRRGRAFRRRGGG